MAPEVRLNATRVRALQLPLAGGGLLSVRYELICALLYNGVHYCTVALDGDTWLRFDGMEHGGVGWPSPSPDVGQYGDGWWPVLVIYGRVDQ